MTPWPLTLLQSDRTVSLTLQIDKQPLTSFHFTSISIFPVDACLTRHVHYSNTCPFWVVFISFCAGLVDLGCWKNRRLVSSIAQCVWKWSVRFIWGEHQNHIQVPFIRSLAIHSPVASSLAHAWVPATKDRTVVMIMVENCILYEELLV